MPTEEERKRQYRNGYSPNGQWTGATPKPFGGVWDSVRSEMSALSRGNPEGRRLYEEGRDAITGGVRRAAQAAFAGNPEGKAVYEQGRDAIMRGPQNPFSGISQNPLSAETVASGVQSVKDWAGRLPARAEAARLESLGPRERARRLEMAGYPSEAARTPNMPQAGPEYPVMAKNQETGQRPEIGLRGENLPPQEGGLGNVSPRPPLGESSRSSSSAAVGTAGAGRGGTGPTISASDQEYLNRQPVTADPRKRYFDMAQMSLEQREKYLNSLPEGQRPIQVIRGNRESWYSPGMSREFGTIPEAMSGVEGRPTLKSEMGREEEARDRAAMVDISGSRNRTTLVAEGMRQAGEDRRLLKEHELGLKNGKGTAKGAGGEKWKVDITNGPDGNPIAFMSDEASGKNVQVKIGDANSVGGALPNFNMEDSKTRHLALDMLNGLGDMAAIESTYRNQPKHVQEAILQAIRERKESEKKK